MCCCIPAATPRSAVGEQVRTAVERGRIRRAEGSDSVGGVTVSIGIAAWMTPRASRR